MKLVRVLVPVATAAALALGPVAADAAGTSKSDPHGDVQYVVLEDGESGQQVTPASHPNGDITGVRVTYTKRSVKILTRYAELNRSGYGAEHVYDLRTSKLRRGVMISVDSRSWGGRAKTVTGSGKKVTCRTTHKVDYTANTVLLVVPATCLGKPGWVRVGMGSITVNSNKIFFDDGQRKLGDFSDDLVMGPRVRRG